MEGVITLSSDDDDDGDIQIIGEKQRVVHPVKEESIEDAVLEECNKLTDRINKRIAPTHLTSSVTISKIEPKSPSSCSRKSAVNGDVHHGEASEDSDDDIICLESESDIKKAQTNGVRCPTNRNSREFQSTTQNQVPKKEPEPISSDDDYHAEKKPDKNGNVHKTGNNNSSKSEVILIDSEDDSNDQKSSDDARKGEEGDSSDDEVQMLEDEDLSNVCNIERSSDDETDGSQDEERKDNPGGSESPAKEDCPSTSRSSADVQPSTSSSSSNQDVDVDELTPSGPGNLTEKLLKQLNVKISQAGFSEENLATVTKKIMKYYNSASDEFTQSQKFIDRVRNLISEMSRLMALPNSKDIAVIKQITDKIKEFLGEFQRGSTQLTPKLNKLHRMLSKLQRRIQKLETQEVDSDSEYENPYIMLDRYRARAVQVYNKIRQLEGKSNHADRLYLQEFIYSGVGPVPVQRALEKYYNKTKSFPDFAEVYKLVKKINTEKSLGLSPSQAHLTAQEVFLDFGKKLKRRREYDDFLIARSYLLDCQWVDPAENDDVLKEKLDINRAIGRTEEDVLKDFTMKEASGEGTSKIDGNKEDGDSSKSDVESSETEKDESDKPKKMFMDSDEEMHYFENVEERRRPGSEEEPVAKKLRLEGEEEEGSAAGPCSPKDQSIVGVEEPVTNPSTKDNFLNKCGLKPS